MLNSLISFLLASLLLPWGLGQVSSQNFSTSVSDQNIPQKVDSSSYGILTTASNVAVIDLASGAVLVNRDDRTPVPIASITKLVTALVLLDSNLNWNDVVTIRAEDWRDGGRRYLWPDEQITVHDLFDLSLAASANEAVIALVRHTGLSEAEFVQKMNDMVSSLGLNNTHFIEPTGLHHGNVASARDLAVLADHAFAQADIARATRLSELSFTLINNGRVVRAFSTNVLLGSFLNNREYEIVGAKTGFLDEAGYCLVMTVAKEGEASLTVVILGSHSKPDRWQEAKGLIDWTYDNYVWPVFN